MTNIGYWIKDTHPYPNAVGVPEDTLISITFFHEMNSHSLNARNILILDGNQGGRLISDQFLFHYEPERKTLLIYLKEDVMRFGTDNCIEVILTGRIANQRNEKMEVPFHLRFMTR